MTLANKLTLARAALGLLTFGCIWLRKPAFLQAAFVLFAVATVTDGIDGWLARRTRSVSPFGVIADPIADKVLVIGALIGFLRLRGLLIPHWAVYLIIVRELVIGGVRTLAGAHGRVLAAQRWGKWAMGVQSACVLAILALIVSVPGPAEGRPAWMQSLPAWLVLLCLAVSWASAALYLRQNRRLLQESWEIPRGP